MTDKIRSTISDEAKLQPLLLGDGYSNIPNLKCPVCHSNMTTTGDSPRLLNGYGSDTTSAHKEDRNFRGDGIAILCTCEMHNHVWEIVFQFHKGATHVFINVLDRRSQHPDGGEE